MWQFVSAAILYAVGASAGVTEQRVTGMSSLVQIDGEMRAGAPDTDGASPTAWRVYEDLRARIINLALPPDETLSRSALAAEFSVSQTPIREALQLLDQDGLIRIFPQSRTVVARISVRELHQAQFLRVSLETEVMRRVADDPDPAALTRARSILRMMEALSAEPQEDPLFHDLDRDFHGVFFAALGLRALHRMLLRRLGHLARCQRLELPRKGKKDEIIAAHAEILQAVQAGNPDSAADAMRRHITGTITRIAALQDELPDYFTDR